MPLSETTAAEFTRSHREDWRNKDVNQSWFNGCLDTFCSTDYASTSLGKVQHPAIAPAVRSLQFLPNPPFQAPFSPVSMGRLCASIDQVKLQAALCQLKQQQKAAVSSEALHWILLGTKRQTEESMVSKASPGKGSTGFHHGGAKRTKRTDGVNAVKRAKQTNGANGVNGAMVPRHKTQPPSVRACSRGKLASPEAFLEVHDFIAKHLAMNIQKKRNFKQLQNKLEEHAKTVKCGKLQADILVISSNFRHEIKKLYRERQRKPQCITRQTLRNLCNASQGMSESEIYDKVSQQMEATLRSADSKLVYQLEDIKRDLTAHFVSIIKKGGKDPYNAENLPKSLTRAILDQHGIHHDCISSIHEPWVNLLTPFDIEMILIAGSQSKSYQEDWEVHQIQDKSDPQQVRLHLTRMKARQAARLLDLHLTGKPLCLSGIHAIPGLRSWSLRDAEETLKCIHTKSVCLVCKTQSSLKQSDL